MSLLEGANEDQGLRYFVSRSQTLPELHWTRAIAEDLLRAVEPYVEVRAREDDVEAGRPVKFLVTVGMPAQQS